MKQKQLSGIRYPIAPTETHIDYYHGEAVAIG